MSKQVYTVDWCMPDDTDKIIKLKEPNLPFDVSEKVHTFLKSKNLYDTLDGKKVEVEIDEKQGKNGTITHLKVVDGKTETSKSEPKQEEKTEAPANGTVKELTVHGVSVAKKGVKFKEEENWFTLDESLDAQEFKDKCTKKKVQVTIVKADKGNDIISSYIISDDEPEEQKETSTSNKSSGSQF